MHLNSTASSLFLLVAVTSKYSMLGFTKSTQLAYIDSQVNADVMDRGQV